MRFKHRKIFFIFLFLSIECFGQSGLLMSVSGRVLDINTNLPVKNFEVTLFRIENGNIVDVEIGKTDERGIYKIRYLKAGDYKYLIEIPNVGIVYIGGENDDGSSYKFTLKEGRNLNLNFFIGASKIIDIKKEIKYDSIMNVTFLYAEKNTEIKMKQLLTSSSGCQLIIEDKPNEPTEAKDDEDIGNDKNGKPAGGKFYYDLTFETTPIECKNKKCKIDLVTLSLKTTIKVRREEWFEKKYNENYKIGIGKCLRECIIKHENKHWEDAAQFAKDNFCMTMETINEVSAKCYCSVSDKKDSVDEEYYPIKCRKGINSLFEKLKIGLDKYLVDPGEANAYGISIPCETVCFKTYLKDGII